MIVPRESTSQDSLDDLLQFRILGTRVGVRSTDFDLLALTQANWGHMASHETHDAILDVVYSVTRAGTEAISIRAARAAANLVC